MREGDKLSIHGEVSDFANGLKEQHPDWWQYELYHALVGSSPHIPCEKHDFPGDNSVIKFVQELKIKHEKLPSHI